MSALRLTRFIRDNSLSVVLFGLFGLFLIGLSVVGYHTENRDLALHDQPNMSYKQYLASSDFAEAVFENWESEFLQMAALVLLTVWLVQKGAPDSKKAQTGTVQTHSRQAIIRSTHKQVPGKGLRGFVKNNSLTLALAALFIGSFVLHAVSGAATANQDAAQHNREQVSVAAYVRSSRFWFESFQNWQSEFLAVGTLMVLSVHLRQKGSPESKPVTH